MEHNSHLLKPKLNADYPLIASGQGIYLYDQQGRRFLDGCSGAVTATIGHGVPEIVAAMQAQASQVAFVYRSQFSSAAAEALATRLARLAPGDLEWVSFVNSGSEATEMALRLALQYWRERQRPAKTRVLSRQISYHGITLGALSLSGHSARRSHYEALLHDFAVAPPAYCYRCPFHLHPQSCQLACANDWERIFAQFDPETIAAVIVEPIVGAAGGAIPAPKGYLGRLRELCDHHEILLIADEVMTGLGRTGDWFACAHDGIVPDLLVLGKGLGAGYAPMAAVLVREPLVATLRNGSGMAGSGHTYSSNPLSAAICLAVLDYIEQHDLLRAARERGAELRAGLERLQQRYAWIGDVRGRGLLLGVELEADRLTQRSGATTADLLPRLVQLVFDHGLLIYPAGIPGQIQAVLVAPPLVISPAQVDELLALLDTTFAALETELGG